MEPYRTQLWEEEEYNGFRKQICSRKMKYFKILSLIAHSQIVTKTITTKHKELELMSFLCKNILSFNKHYCKFGTMS